jgi:hypothetical protein
MTLGTLRQEWRLRRSGLVRVSIAVVSMLLVAGFAPDDDHAMRDKLIGKWQQSDGSDTTKPVWTLQNNGDSMHISNSNGTRTVGEFDCNTVGKECEIDWSGHRSKVSMWFNGAKLIELETTGNQVIKRRFGVTGEGDSMVLETIPIAPDGSSTVAHFKRVSADVSKK